MTHEHLVPACFGGVDTIYVCRPCNERRGNSFTDANFLSFIRNDPSLFILHVERSDNNWACKQKLLSLVEGVFDVGVPNPPHPEPDHVLHFIRLHHMNRNRDVAQPVSDRTQELIQQCVALELAKAGTPIPGGRAERSRRRALRRREVKRSRRNLKALTNGIKKRLNY